jgi:hypothetical protein
LARSAERDMAINADARELRWEDAEALAKATIQL